MLNRTTQNAMMQANAIQADVAVQADNMNDS